MPSELAGGTKCESIEIDGGTPKQKCTGLRQYFYNALVAQLAEVTRLERVKCRFESDRGYQIEGCATNIAMSR